MEESTLRWATDKEREEMEEVCSIGEVPHTYSCTAGYLSDTLPHPVAE